LSKSSNVENPGFSEELIDAIVKRVVEALQGLGTESPGKKSIDELKQNPLDLNSAS
jgi:hypothetical protein